jgi:hypothetical protein
VVQLLAWILRMGGLIILPIAIVSRESRHQDEHSLRMEESLFRRLTKQVVYHQNSFEYNICHIWHIVNSASAHQKVKHGR